ncbi:hypothetical protein GOBAR_AA00506 [Gossypium barbadense]|uniref:Salicylate carboxymethyltransferase n=1 Tax=Gossypium barbadense TaxID=3634 RepID=A0A2P5YWX7_GOSBA|nr:hypothetical protein GOBAR_AA00506 [Gossypium barbadense]
MSLYRKKWTHRRTYRSPSPSRCKNIRYGGNISTGHCETIQELFNYEGNFSQELRHSYLGCLLWKKGGDIAETSRLDSSVIRPSLNHVALSKVPPALYDEHGKSINKGNVYISESSPPSVSQAYYKQFQEDFSLFLKSRSEELVTGGRMVLILLGRIGQDHVDRGNSFFWEILSRSLAISVSQAEIEKEKVDSYEVHFYAASKNELEDEVRREGSFEIDKLEMFEIEREVKNGESYGTAVAMTVRAVQESMLCDHFGDGMDLDTLFNNYGKMIDEEMVKVDIKPITFVIVLKKL